MLFDQLLKTFTVLILICICLSVSLSVTFRCFVQRNEDTILRSSVSGSTINLVSEEVKFIRRGSPAVKHPYIASKNLTNNQP